MAIALAKTLQGTPYNLYITTKIRSILSDRVLVTAEMYQSQGHYNDGFIPIIRRNESVNSPSIMALVRAMHNEDTEVTRDILARAIESFLVASVDYYSEGQIVS